MPMYRVNSPRRIVDRNHERLLARIITQRLCHDLVDNRLGWRGVRHPVQYAHGHHESDCSLFYDKHGKAPKSKLEHWGQVGLANGSKSQFWPGLTSEIGRAHV